MQQIDFIRYDLTTGRILSAISCPQYAYAFNTPPSTEIGYLSGKVEDTNAYYVLNEEVTLRPSFNLPTTAIQIQANGIDSFELSDLPANTVVTITPSEEQAEYTIDDGELSFATEQAGIYTIQIKAFPYLDTTITVEAVL